LPPRGRARMSIPSRQGVVRMAFLREPQAHAVLIRVSPEGAYTYPHETPSHQHNVLP
jgi:hypothetical protein